MKNKALTYKDVYLVPKMGILETREDADLSVSFLGQKFRAPWLPANMSSVITSSICKWLSENDYFYIMHRFGGTLEFVRRANKERWNTISISVGVKQADRELLRTIAGEKLRVDYVTLDIAHGHSVLAKEMLDFIRSIDFTSHWGAYVQDSFAIQRGHWSPGRGWTSVPLSYLPKIIAGNVATPEAVEDLADWGADAVKVGIGGGSPCSTKNQTGFHVPMFSCVEKCVVSRAMVPIIADGGIREPGDIAKALVAGADMVMIGGLFAGCIDAPGENVYKERSWLSGDGVTTCRAKDVLVAKKFHGSASEHQKGFKKHVEGFLTEVPCNGMTYEEYYQCLKEALSSAVSYAGGKNLTAFDTVEWVETK